MSLEDRVLEGLAKIGEIFGAALAKAGTRLLYGDSLDEALAAAIEHLADEQAQLKFKRAKETVTKG